MLSCTLVNQCREISVSLLNVNKSEKIRNFKRKCESRNTFRGTGVGEDVTVPNHAGKRLKNLKLPRLSAGKPPVATKRGKLGHLCQTREVV